MGAIAWAYVWLSLVVAVVTLYENERPVSATKVVGCVVAGFLWPVLIPAGLIIGLIGVAKND